MELLVPFDDKSAPIYEQIYRFIKEEIQQGRILAHTKLPSTRQLSKNLGVSRSTVQLAYDQLTAEGYLEPEACRGYFVAEIDVLLSMDEKESGCREASVLPVEEKAERKIDFSPRGIDLDHFPLHTWRKLSRETLTMANKNLFTSGEPKGELALRQAICRYLQSARGVTCLPEQMIVGAGSEYLLMLLNQILGNHKIAMEDPTYKQAYRVFRRLGHPVVPVPMDKNGMEVEALRSSGAKIAYIMPSHQYPTGIVMPIRRRQELLNWAGEVDGRYIIEDDYDSEFRYRGKPIPALGGFDQKERVIYLGTFSKAVAPAIRVSFLVLPKHLIGRYQENCGFYSSTVSRVDQEILRRFLEEGYFERHLNRMRGIYRNKHDKLIGELEPLEDRFLIQGDMAGLHVLLESKQGRTERELLEAAEAAGVRVYGLSSYFLAPDQRESHTVILGYANLTQEQIEEGIRKLDLAWR
ncbi:PLP-dependent aminotransferase family protein [Hominifimenecus sp. rT4P-3]|uniref:MocR-like pyridoxine biosynthesis transcription factor PdxR n=1 Tax=Hominifimenecus sp. rT4P-3 TaxID=3242979 RepID=UPI003DA3C0B0